MKTIFALLCAAALTGCVVAPHSASVYEGRQTMNEQTVRMGTVDAVREVSIAHRDSGTGTHACRRRHPTHRKEIQALPDSPGRSTPAAMSGSTSSA